MLARLKRIKFAADVAVLEMPPGIKDPNELHKWKKRDFPVAFQELLDTATPTGASAVAKAEILDAAPSTISRPLCIVQGHAYASTWLHIKEPDRDLLKRQLCIQRSDWRGHVTVPKGGPLRYVPMTSRLALALREHRHLKSPRVLCQDDGSPLTQDIVGKYVRKTGRKAGIAASGAHRLRHTFCSHLAMRGAPARAIQELAGHQDLGTTQRYMHLSPSAVENAQAAGTAAAAHHVEKYGRRRKRGSLSLQQHVS